MEYQYNRNLVIDGESFKNRLPRCIMGEFVLLQSNAPWPKKQKQKHKNRNKE